MKKDNVDLKIRKAMVDMSEDVQPSDDMFEKIKSQIEFEQSRKEKVVTMKRNRKMLKVASVACALMITTVGVYAGGKAVGYFGSSSNVYKYKEVPTIEQMEKETGVRKAFVDEFANGYKFDGAVIEDLNTTGSNGDALDKTKAMNLVYKKAGEPEVFVDAHKKMPSEIALEEQDGYRTVDVNRTKLFVSSLNMRFVPADHEKTAEEKQLEKEGKMTISYGSDKVEDKKSVTVAWEKDGVRYSISSLSDEGMPEQTLIDMAEELI